MIQKIPRYLLTFHSTSGAIAVERFCKKHKIPGRLIPVPREISASCGLSWAVEAEQEKCLTQVELEFEDEIEGKWLLLILIYLKPNLIDHLSALLEKSNQT